MTFKKPCGLRCTCPANSPFLTYKIRRDSFAVSLRKGHLQAKAMTEYVDVQRSAGIDVGHIQGLSEKSVPLRGRPSDFVAEVEGS